uniref:HAD hydrolase-like protein n=1 Tax=Eubacterium sp. TaxID=142586 RepID=UPI004027BD34
MKFKSVIFDFDGTICKTGEGIIKSAKYALEAFGYDVPEDDSELEFFIGPPLLVTFQERFGADPQTALELVKKYRERYTNQGVYESELYEDIRGLLEALKNDGIKIGIASSKPQKYIETLLEKFGVIKYFDAICGVSFTADCETKASIITRCLAELNTPPDSAIMVGDKNYDIAGAKANNLLSVGVLWGYGNKFEFIEAGADFIAEKPQDIEAVALGYFEQTEESTGIFNGRIITVHEDTVQLVDGTQAKREIVDHNGGVAIIGLTEESEVLLVRQFRAPYKEVLFEIPAGKLEKGEDPFEAAKREFQEECGCTAENFKYIGELYPTPGYCGEIIRLYYATGLEFGEQHLDEDERLDVYKVPLGEAFDRCINGEFKDAKTQIGIMKVREMLNNGSLS